MTEEITDCLSAARIVAAGIVKRNLSLALVADMAPDQAHELILAELAVVERHLREGGIGEPDIRTITNLIHLEAVRGTIRAVTLMSEEVGHA